MQLHPRLSDDMLAQHHVGGPLDALIHDLNALGVKPLSDQCLYKKDGFPRLASI